MIKIEALYTEACNLYGDRFNVTYLEKSLQGQAEFIYTSLNETPRFVTEDVDMIYMGAMPEKEQEYPPGFPASRDPGFFVSRWHQSLKQKPPYPANGSGSENKIQLLHAPGQVECHA